jgi:hypothetical protein
MRNLAPLVGAVAAFALFVPAAHAADPHVTTSISPRPALFGDVIHAVITVRGDARAAIQNGFSPFQVLREASNTTRTQDIVVTRWDFDLQCLEARCAPGPGSREVAITASRIRVGSHTLEARFQPIRIDPRATQAQVADPERSFRHPIDPPAPSFRFAPATIRRILAGAAVLLVLIALALIVPLARPRRRPADPERVDSLADALALVAAARSRSPSDRRRALGLLARTLRMRGAAEEGQAAADLAWSEPDPVPLYMDQLVERIERTP